MSANQTDGVIGTVHLTSELGRQLVFCLPAGWSATSPPHVVCGGAAVEPTLTNATLQRYSVKTTVGDACTIADSGSEPQTVHFMVEPRGAEMLRITLKSDDHWNRAETASEKREALREYQLRLSHGTTGFEAVPQLPLIVQSKGGFKVNKSAVNFQSCNAPGAEQFAFCDEALSTDERTEDLLSRMNLHMKLGMLSPNPVLGGTGKR